MTEAYPLSWPEGRARTPSWRRQRSRFNTGFGAAVNSVVSELRRLGARSVVISSNVQLRRDGLPLASAKRVDDTGVAVYFYYKDKQTCFACDRWDKVEDNIYAVSKTVEAMRGIARWGTGDMLDAAFRGFTALPPPPSEKPWHEVLNIAKNAPLDVIEEKYRSLARVHHPDLPGGTAHQMAKINRAIELARKEKGA